MTEDSGMISMRVSEDDPDVAYVYLVGEPRPKSVRQVRLSDVVVYRGADVFLDLDADGNLLGIEILA